MKNSTVCVAFQPSAYHIYLLLVRVLIIIFPSIMNKNTWYNNSVKLKMSNFYLSSFQHSIVRKLAFFKYWSCTRLLRMCLIYKSIWSKNILYSLSFCYKEMQEIFKITVQSKNFSCEIILWRHRVSLIFCREVGNA